MRALTLSLLTASLLAASGAKAETNVFMILDGSNSMWGQVDGVAKIETAREAVKQAAGSLGKDTNLGLVVYGHRSEGDCKDVEVVLPLAPADSQAMGKALKAITPKGKTPITYALEQTAAQFKQNDANNQILLISDGLETCGSDPCATVKALKAKGVNMTVHVVGFDVKNDKDKSLQCIAEAGGGKFFEAGSAQSFKDALGQAAKEVEAKPAAPVEPQYKEVFFDDFNGKELGPSWQIVGEDQNGYIVENGNLMILSNSTANLTNAAQPKNLFKLIDPLPEGDWRATVKFTADPATLKEVFSLSLIDDDKNQISAKQYFYQYVYDAQSQLLGQKYAGGQETRFTQLMFEDKACQYCELAKLTESAKKKIGNVPAYLRLTKKGRDFLVEGRYETTPQEKGWFKVAEMSSLRAKGNLALSFSQYENNKGESKALVDWVRVEAAEAPAAAAEPEKAVPAPQ